MLKNITENCKRVGKESKYIYIYIYTYENIYIYIYEKTLK